MVDAFHDAETVMAHLRALRQELLTTSMEPAGDQARSGLTAPQIGLIRSLVVEGSATVTELARRLSLSHSTTSGIVDRLQARGLVTREVDPSDRRYTRVQVTEPVQNYTREISEGPYARLTCVLAEASPAERKAVLDGLETLRALLAR
ncbi:MarR family winged helix-turn-helix transcriptional regulator [Lentzea aerocolonigenes]|jgi:DNA-binding MarR family transcriptional regulator|uniref:MarR family winged helix-turn-helix transcriptional regulator n=1 Tax=Lentzea aerocolonigenes TaxID=68170 RepID=UPI00069129A1|nr:MarR family transcriptional regulator [Lentzea aerocolonigenes]MCP2250055.1 DNA-binding transcriptional regulator, MarR family [Lentzea aerocolonigenes]